MSKKYCKKKKNNLLYKYKLKKGDKAMIKERNIVTCILLSIVTCGIYGIYWFITLTDDVSRANEDPNFTGVKSLLLSIVTCGIYGFYWNYKIGKELFEANQKKGITANDNSTIYLILGIFGLSIVTYCMAQNELNAIAKKNN